MGKEWACENEETPQCTPHTCSPGEETKAPKEDLRQPESLPLSRQSP